MKKLFGKASPTISPNPTKVMPDYNLIHQEMKRKKKTKVTLMFLWEEYKATYGERAYAYTQFRVYYRRYKQKLNPSMRQIHIAGEKVFVDYSGVTIPIHNQKTKEVAIAKADVTKNPKLAKKFMAQSVPLIVVIGKDKMVKRAEVGLLGIDAYIKMIDKALGKDEILSRLFG